MNSQEICETLQINRRILGVWIKRGMPHTREGRAYQFDDEAVRKWLLQEGLVREENVVGAAGDVANHFGVSERTVQYWRNKGMPGEPGYFNLDAIALWRTEQGHASGQQTPSTRIREELLEIEKETKAARLQQLRGELVELDPVRRAGIRHIFEAKAILERIPDEVLALLPAKTPARVKRPIREQVLQLVDAACQGLADMLRTAEITGGEQLSRQHRQGLIDAALAGASTTEQRAICRARLKDLDSTA